MANGTVEDWAPESRSDTDEEAVRESARSSSSPAAARVAATVARRCPLARCRGADHRWPDGGAEPRARHPPPLRGLSLGLPDDMILLLTLVPYWLFLLYAFGLYRASGASIRGASIENAMRGFTALTVGSWLLFLLMVLLRGIDSPLGALAVFWAVAAVAVPVGRWTARALVWRRRAFAERVLIVGAGTVGHTLAAKIAKHPEYRIELVGFLEDGRADAQRDRAGGPGHRLAARAGRGHPRERVNRVILAFSQARHQQFLTVARICAEHGVKVNIVPRLFEVLSSQGRRRRPGGHPPARRGPGRAQPAEHDRQAYLRPSRRRHPHRALPAAVRRHRRAHQAGLARARLLPPGAHGPPRPRLQDRQVPQHDGRRRRAA